MRWVNDHAVCKCEIKVRKKFIGNLETKIYTYIFGKSGYRLKDNMKIMFERKIL